MPDRFEISQPGFNNTFQSRDGLVGRDLSTRATRVQLAAKAQTGVRTGANKRDITKQWTSTSGTTLTIKVGAARPYSLAHHEGTRSHVIRAKNAKALRFMNKAGDVVFARGVMHPGTRPNRYLTDNLHLAVRG
jgi:hypothetical protein